MAITILGVDKDSRPFMDLFGDDGAALKKVYAAEGKAVYDSFVHDHNNTPTEAETKRRINICHDLVRLLRGELGWGSSRICDNLGRFLRHRLDGVAFDPGAERSIWAPTDGT